MEFRVGHEVRYEITVDAPNKAEAERIAAAIPYTEWPHSYVTIEDCIPVEESPINPEGE